MDDNLLWELLKPCSYCEEIYYDTVIVNETTGKEEAIARIFYGHAELCRDLTGLYYVECDNCNARTNLYYRADQAIEAWNKDEIFKTDDPKYPEIDNEI